MKKYYVLFLGIAQLASAMDQEQLGALDAADMNMAQEQERTFDAHAAMAQYLNGLLAHEFALYTKTLKSHWNVLGMSFGPLHKLFGDQYEQLQTIIDRVAERVRALQFFAIGTLQEFSALSTLPEFPGAQMTDREMIANLLADHERVIALLQEAIGYSAQIGDAGTNNMLSDIVTEHQKMAWMLRAHLQ